jgi:hypothetical protein
MNHLEVLVRGSIIGIDEERLQVRFGKVELKTVLRAGAGYKSLLLILCKLLGPHIIPR